MNERDKQILRELGKQVAEIAHLPLQEETRRLWKALNSLKPERPMVAIDQIPWHEMNVDDELTLKCEDGFARELEWKLRETLYRWKHMRADMVVEKHIDVSKVIHNTGFGLKIEEDIAVLDKNNDVVGHWYHDQLQTEEDLEKIKTPVIALDKEATAVREEKAKEVFDGILEVNMTGMGWKGYYFAPWDLIVQWHGVENSLIDLADRPDFVHSLLERLTSAYMGLADQLEEQGLFHVNMPTIHCTGAYTDELPAPGFEPARPRAKDVWTCGMAQIFASVSPEMHQEFELNYGFEYYERFGLVYYGCCEPLHDKIHLVRKIPNLRKISISPLANVQRAAEQIGGDFVLSRKPSPAYLAYPDWDPGIVKADLEDTRRICAANGTPVEFILKDISTVNYQPRRLWEWADIAMRIAREGL